jgi:hypothetical protein
VAAEPQVNIQMVPHSGVVAFDAQHNAFPVVGWYASARGKAGAGVVLYPLVLNCGRIESLTGVVLYSLVGNMTDAWLDLARYHNADGAGGPVPTVAPPAATGAVGYAGAEGAGAGTGTAAGGTGGTGTGGTEGAGAEADGGEGRGRHSVESTTTKLAPVVPGVPGAPVAPVVPVAVTASRAAVAESAPPEPAGEGFGALRQDEAAKRGPSAERPAERGRVSGQPAPLFVSASEATTDPRIPERIPRPRPRPAPVPVAVVEPDPLVDPLPEQDGPAGGPAIPDAVRDVLNQTRNGHNGATSP